VQIDWFTFFAQIVNFLILIGLLQRFLYKPVIKAMDEREERITNELEEARQKKVEAEQQEKELEQEKKDFESRKNELMEEAQEEIKNKRKEWLDDLRTEISDIRKRWVESLENEREAFISHLKKETGQQIISLMRQVLIDLSEQNLEEQTLRHFLDKVKNLDEKEKNRLTETVVELKNKRAIIFSSFELDKTQKKQLGESLNKIADTKLEYEYKRSEDLGFGLEVRINGWQLGWNMKTYLDRLGNEMNQFFREETPIEEATGLE
jgi:F-type H+-transporting ATPase subunit b